MRVDRLAQVPKLLVRRLDIFDLEKFRRLSRGARDCVTEDELRKPKRSFAVLPLVLGWCSRDMACGEGMDGDSETEEGACGDWATKYACLARPSRSNYDLARGELFPPPATPEPNSRGPRRTTWPTAGERPDHEENACCATVN